MSLIRLLNAHHRLMHSPSLAERWSARGEIAVYGGWAARLSLRRAAASADPLTRELAAEAMGLLDDPSLHDDLASLTQDSEPSVAAAAHDALRSA